MIDSRDLADLNEATRSKCASLIEKCRAIGTPIIVTSTYRDNEYQDKLFQQGRTTPGKKVTNSKAGTSYHNYKCAFDVVPLDVNGKAKWDDEAAWQRVGQLGREIGLEWGGDFKSFKDKPHFQNTGGRSIQSYLEKGV